MIQDEEEMRTSEWIGEFVSRDLESNVAVLGELGRVREEIGDDLEEE